MTPDEKTTVRAVKDIISGISMKEKYEDLCRDEAILSLPSDYKHLHRLFEYLDNNLNFLKARKYNQRSL